MQKVKKRDLPNADSGLSSVGGGILTGTGRTQLLKRRNEGGEGHTDGPAHSQRY